MESGKLHRRDFNRLAMAALGGMVAGTAISRGDEEKKEKGEDNPLLHDPHVCRGLNTCKGKGKSGDNACAGQGDCATASAHTCKGDNDCKGQGGCGENPGENSCKGKGACNVPLKAKTWTKARKRYEELMTKAGKKFGDAPAKKE